MDTLQNSNGQTFPIVMGLVPAYNAEKFILPTLESLALQDYPNLHVWICDDASTDRTFEVCQEFATRHPNFRVTRNEKNMGWLKTSGYMWEVGASESEFCFTNPHDDHPMPDYVSDLVTRLIENPRSVLAIPGMRNIYSDGGTIDSFFTTASGQIDLIERLMILANRQVHHWWSAYHGLHKSEKVAKILPFKSLPFGEPEYSVDLVWIIKMAIKGEFVTSEKILLTKNYRKESVSAQWGKGIINRLGLWVSIIQGINETGLLPEDQRKFRRAIKDLIIQKARLRLPFT